jgi:transposase-like protein
LTLFRQRRSVATSTLDLYTGIARELCIRLNQRRKWRLEFEQEERTGAPKRLPVVDQDFARLRRENATLREETT